MQTSYSHQEKEKIRREIRKKYAKVAENPESLFRYPTGKPGLEALHYDADILAKLPGTVTASFCGVGNPFAAGSVNRDDRVLDVGCGAGVDTIFAAKMTGTGGTVAGIDAVTEMLRRAGKNLAESNVTNVYLARASAEELPFRQEVFDVAVSNGALNLVPDKDKALSELFRVLKPAGRLMVADQVLVGELPADREQLIESWSR